MKTTKFFDIMPNDSHLDHTLETKLKSISIDSSDRKGDVEEPTRTRILRRVGVSQPADKREDMGRSVSGMRFRYIPKRLSLRAETKDRLRRENTRALLHEKKLALVLDLDHTLLNSTSLDALSPQEERLLENPNTGTLFRSDFFLTKLRPYVHAFLEEASKMFDVYVYTMAKHSYAMRMARHLDPRGIFFEFKVISQEDSTEPSQKGLDVVLEEERAVVILDDTQHVWRKNQENLIVMERYNFFASSHRAFGLAGGSLSELEKDEGEADGALSTTLDVLKRVHRMFFDLPSHLVDGDVRKVLRTIRDEVQQGCRKDTHEKVEEELATLAS